MFGSSARPAAYPLFYPPPPPVDQVAVEERAAALGRRSIKEAAKVAMLWKFSYMLLIPALSVSSLILGFNLMADGLREMSLRD